MFLNYISPLCFTMDASYTGMKLFLEIQHVSDLLHGISMVVDDLLF